MKKYLLSLILILLLTFTLIGNCDWLDGWDYRIECKIEDYAGDIGGEVVWFPATVFLTATQAEEVFTELTTDAEYKKMQFTQSDGTSLLYGEKELFDVSEKLGVFHVSRDGWTINANTSVFMYYDKDHVDNTTYIGAITARIEVWDGNTEGHWDMAQDPDGDGANAIKDSTSNTRHLTPSGSMTTADLVDGKVGKAIDFEGTDDALTRASGNVGITNAYTTTSIVKLDVNAHGTIFCLKPSTGNANMVKCIYFALNLDEINASNKKSDDSAYIKDFTSNGTIATATWYHIATTWDGTDLHIYIDGTQSTPYTKYTDGSGTMTNTERLIWIGSMETEFWNGIIDESSYASVARTPAWIKGLYNSGNDTLFTYGSEESIEVEVNAIFFGANF